MSTALTTTTPSTGPAGTPAAWRAVVVATEPAAGEHPAAEVAAELARRAGCDVQRIEVSPRTAPRVADDLVGAKGTGVVLVVACGLHGRREWRSGPARLAASLALGEGRGPDLLLVGPRARAPGPAGEVLACAGDIVEGRAVGVAISRWRALAPGPVWLLDTASTGVPLPPAGIDGVQARRAARTALELSQLGVHAEWEVLHGASAQRAIAAHAVARDPALLVLPVLLGRPGIDPLRLALGAPAPVLLAPRPVRPALVTSPHPPAPDVRASRHPARPHVAIRAALVLVALVTTLAGAAWLGGPYYVLEPGAATSLTDRVQVAGAVLHPPEGDVLLTSVTARRTGSIGAARAWLDPTSAVHRWPGPRSERLAVPGRRVIDDSKQAAVVAALRYLGHDPAPRGTGATVVDVDPSGEARWAIRPGDVIVAVAGHTVTRADDLATILGLQTTEVVTVVIEPGGRGPSRTVEVPVHPGAGAAASLGITLATRDLTYEVPITATIRSGTLQGPSAGLAFALAVLDLLSPGELTGGLRVAATGTIDPEGRVGAVAGIGQKALAARRAGADVLLVPIGAQGAAQARAGAMRVEAVGSLAEAVAVLERLGGEAGNG